MQIIKLDATESTNAFLKNLIFSESQKDYTVVVAEEQLNGRGQMGTNWQSEPGKNLTFSILRNFNNFKIKDHFVLNIITSLAVYSSLEALKIPNLKVKWPNDILSGSQKICGILPENIIKNDLIKSSVIGIGLNVNQTDFVNLPLATSLKNIMGSDYSTETIMNSIVWQLRKGFELYESGAIDILNKNYESSLFRKDKASTFKKLNEETFTGIIRGITETGKISIEIEDEILKEFAFKEIELLY